MRRLLLTILLFSIFVAGATAQIGVSSKKNNIRTSHWSVGIGGGARINFMKITHLSANLDTDRFPRLGGVFSAFVCREFLDGIIVVRPQVSYACRGGNYFCFKFNEEIICLDYDVRMKYIDFRMPLIFNFADSRSRSPIVPYVYVSPIFGGVLGGEISFKHTDDDYNDVVGDKKVQGSKANVAERYFGVGAGVGAKYKFEINRKEMFFGLEIVNDFGLSDTYSPKERDGKVNDVGLLVDYTNYKLKGKRKFYGLEMQVFVSMPFNMFAFKKKERPQSTRSVRNL